MSPGDKSSAGRDHNGRREIQFSYGRGESDAHSFFPPRPFGDGPHRVERAAGNKSIGRARDFGRESGEQQTAYRAG